MVIFVSPYFVYYMKTYSRHPGLNQNSNIKRRALRKKRIASQAYDTSINSLQLFVTQGILEMKIFLCIHRLLMHFLSISFSSFPLHPHEYLASTARCGQELHSPLHPSLHGLFLTSSDAPSCSTEGRAAS